VWERSAGQLVLLALTVGAVVLVPSPLTSWWPRAVPAVLLGAVTVAVVVLVVLVVLVALVTVVGSRGRARPGADARWGARWGERWSDRWERALPARVLRVAAADARAGLRGRHTGSGVVALSTLVVAGHVATFVLAARSAGVTAPVASLVPVALVVLVAMGLPLNLAGWGPREGVAAWAFGAMGLGAAAGVGTAVVYGVMAFASALPGAALLALSHRRSPRPTGVLATEGAVGG
jgi:uncharacterized membrane protein YbhN (UPF0104 family)